MSLKVKLQPKHLVALALGTLLALPAQARAQEASNEASGEASDVTPEVETEAEGQGRGEADDSPAHDEDSSEVTPSSAPVEGVSEAAEEPIEVLAEAVSGDMTDEDTEAPMEVTVVGTSVSRTAGSAHVIKEAQLERFEYDDPAAVIQQVPGAYVRQEDGIGLRPNIGIRGVNPDRSKKLTLMEDGVLFGPAPYSAPAAYYFPLMTRMSSVRVIKGPGSVAHGPQTVAGAIDLVTRPIPSSTKGGLDLAFGEYGYAKAHGHFGDSGERFGFLVEGAHLHNDGFKTLPNGGNTGSTRNEWMVKSSYVLDPDARTWNEFSIKLGYTDEVSNETYLGLSDADFRKDPYRRYAASSLDQMKSHRTAIVLSHLLDVPDASLQVRTSVYRHDLARVWSKVNGFRGASLFDVLRNPDDPSHASYYAVLTGEADTSGVADILMIGPNDRRYRSQGIQSTLSARPKTGPIHHRIEAGIRLHNDSITRRHSESGYQLIGGQLVSDGEAETVTSANVASSHALATHVTDAMSFHDLTLTPGVRMELVHSEVDDHLSGDKKTGLVHAVLPGLGAFYGLTNHFGLLAGVHRGFSPPPPGSEGHIEPEYSINYEAGARFSSRAARAEVIGFFNDYSNLTDICTLSSGCVSDNLDRQFDAGKAHIYGFEAYLAHDIPLGMVTVPVTVAYTFTRAEFQNSFVSQDPIYGTVKAGDEIPYIPRHQVNASVGVEGKLGGVVAGVGYVSPMREEAGKGPMREALHTDEQFLVDVGGRLRVYGPVLVYANVRNLLGAQDIVSRRPYGARPNAPRWIQVGGKVEF